MKKTYTKPALKIVLLKSDKHLLGDCDYKVNSYKETEAITVGDTEE